MYLCIYAKKNCSLYARRMEMGFVRENGELLFYRQRKHWLAGMEAECWLVDRSGSGESPDISGALTADRACTHLTSLPWQSHVGLHQFSPARLTRLWLIMTTCLHCARLVCVVTLCFMAAAVRVKGCRACIMGRMFFWPVKLSIPGNSFSKVPNIYYRTVDNLVKGF